MSRKIKKTKPAIEAGQRVQTNTAFSALFTPRPTNPWHGTAQHPHPGVAGCWVVRLDDTRMPLQYISERFLEAEQ